MSAARHCSGLRNATSAPRLTLTPAPPPPARRRRHRSVAPSLGRQNRHHFRRTQPRSRLGIQPIPERDADERDRRCRRRCHPVRRAPRRRDHDLARYVRRDGDAALRHTPRLADPPRARTHSARSCAAGAGTGTANAAVRGHRLGAGDCLAVANPSANSIASRISAHSDSTSQPPDRSPSRTRPRTPTPTVQLVSPRETSDAPA